MKSIAEIFRSYGVLDENGRHINGTDKMTNHNYGDAYERLFAYVTPAGYTDVPVFDAGGYGLKSYRDEVKLMMEVGVADGSCLLAWREIFPNATIVGMDIHPICKSGERIEKHIGDQRSKLDCENVAAGRQFDLIVEDATHHLDATLLTFFYLWPFVKPDGLYVIEEFPNVDAVRKNIEVMWPTAEIVDTKGPFGGNEPLVVFRKSI